MMITELIFNIREFINATNDRNENFINIGTSNTKVNGEFLEVYDKLKIEADEAEEIIHEFMYEGLVQMNIAATTGTYILIVSIAVSFILAIIIGILLSRGIVKPIQKIINVLDSGSTQISSASTQLSASSQDIASGALEQSSSIEETTASMEELSAMVKQNASNSKQTSRLAEEATVSSKDGYSQMEVMLHSMEDINKSASKIGKIVKTIDDIAFQTNILALNAAVEAARAGEAGMGFAVVADEVKNLANKSAEAAKETTDIIEDSIKKTNSGLDITKNMTSIFKDILSNITKVSEMAKEVDAASEEQSSGINQVNTAILQFDNVVQSNTATAEESATASLELSAQADSLQDVVLDLIYLVTGKVQKKRNIRKSMKKTQKESSLLSHKKESYKLVDDDEQSPESLISFEEDEEFTED